MPSDLPPINVTLCRLVGGPIDGNEYPIPDNVNGAMYRLVSGDKAIYERSENGRFVFIGISPKGVGPIIQSEVKHHGGNE
jgi:hypothetical protein